MSKNNKLESLFNENDFKPYDADNFEETKIRRWNSGQEILQIPIKQLFDFPKNPFPLYTGERKEDMVESIKKYGIIQPLILRENEKKLEILSGHNRKYCALLAKMISVPAIIKHDITDEDAYRYVIESNLMQRSFSELKHSEKAIILAHEHSKLFSQGKRNDIIKELELLDQTSNPSRSSTFRQVGEKLNSDENIAQNYNLSARNVSRYLRINHLIDAFKAQLDSEKLPFTVAVTLSFLKNEEQEMLEKHMAMNSFFINTKKANKLKILSQENQLDEVNLYNILLGDDFRMSETHKTPDIRIPPKVLIKYFSDAKSKKEIQDKIEKALEFYDAHQAGKKIKIFK